MKTRMKKGLLVGLAFLGAALGAPTSSQASDHVDGLKTAIDNSADITDLYTFTSPKDANKLVLIMNVHGFAAGVSRFSNAVDYKFRIRPIDNAQTMAPSTDTNREQSIVCSFRGGAPLINSEQQATCRFNFGTSNETITWSTRKPGFKAGGSAEKNGIKVFAGVRSDSWFLDIPRTVEYSGGHKPLDVLPPINGLIGTNVLSIVVEVDKRKLAGPLLAITAQTVRK